MELIKHFDKLNQKSQIEILKKTKNKELIEYFLYHHHGYITQYLTDNPNITKDMVDEYINKLCSSSTTREANCCFLMSSKIQKEDIEKVLSVFGEHYEINHFLLRNPNVNLNSFDKDYIKGHLINVCLNPKIENYPDIIKMIFLSGYQVRESLAANEYLSEDLYLKIAKDKSKHVLTALLQNKNLPRSVVEKILLRRKEEFLPIYKIDFNLLTADEISDMYYNMHFTQEENKRMHEKLIQYQNTPSKIYNELINYYKDDNLFMLRNSPDTEKCYTLYSNLKDKLTEIVYWSIFKNPKVSDKILKEIIFDEKIKEPYYRDRAKAFLLYKWGNFN